MYISPIGAVTANYRSYNINKSKNASRISDTKTNFTGNYNDVYQIVRNRNFQKSYDVVQNSFKELVLAAKCESGLSTKFIDLIDYYSMRYTTQNFKKLNSSSQEIVLKSRNYDVPLITTQYGELSFHDPINGAYGNGNITFWIGRNGINVSRPKDFHGFHHNEKIREYYRNIEDGGGIIDHVYYNKDGSESFWKNLF